MAHRASLATQKTPTSAPPLDPTTLGDILRVASASDYARWEDQVRRTGGCSDPIHITGWVLHKDRTTGETLHHYSTADEPGGRLRLACGNRRASRCPSCAWTYAGDTYHLIRAGLAGDDRRDIPATVRDHPRVFATLTAPSFGPVHNRPDRGTCRCGTRHQADDPALGTALDPDTYDYSAAVLFNNHAGQLWQRFTTRLRRELAARAGLTRRELADHLRVSFGKVAEFQKRGALHFHAVIRLDGPKGLGTSPPTWATVDFLADAIRAAATHSYTSASVPAAGDQPARTFRWGAQLDVRPIKAFGDGSDITEQAVASYIAKYATKAAENIGAVDSPVHCRRCQGTGRSRRYNREDSALSRCATCHGTGMTESFARLDIPDHARRLMAACAQLQPLYPDRQLARWAHMLGFRGHFSSKSRCYSTTLGALRQARADYRAAQEREVLGRADVEPDTVYVLADWQYSGHGHTPGESALAASIARDLQLNRETAREALRDQIALEGAAA
ncbi:replication initiator [Streptomyces sp. NPDC058739]|uniref:replication initiator n=1 Tax=Streptomyces sp. NPDC058739 TaxID=3346618 RepID=UPI0036C71225